MFRTFALVLVLASAFGCAHSGAPMWQLSSRASKDLSCKSDQLIYNNTAPGTFEVAGCGNKATYTEVCKPDCQQKGCCTWEPAGEAPASADLPAESTTTP